MTTVVKAADADYLYFYAIKTLYMYTLWRGIYVFHASKIYFYFATMIRQKDNPLVNCGCHCFDAYGAYARIIAIKLYYLFCLGTVCVLFSHLGERCGYARERLSDALICGFKPAWCKMIYSPVFPSCHLQLLLLLQLGGLTISRSLYLIARIYTYVCVAQ